MAKYETPLLDQLETGPWPSFVTDIKRQDEFRKANQDKIEYQIPVDVCEDLLGVRPCQQAGQLRGAHGYAVP